MRICTSILLLGIFSTAVTWESSGFAADDAKAKTAQEQKKELKKKQREEALKKAAEAAKAAASKAATPAPVTAPKAPPTQTPAPTSKPVPALGVSELAKMIDDQLDQKLAEAKVSASAPCTDAEFLRRVYLDITGVIPTGDQAKAFLDSTDPQKRSKLVNELLDSPNYGRHQSDMWVPKIFPRDSANRFVLRDPLAKWIESEFNKNTPWNKFVYSLVTATGPVDENPAVTYFLANRSIDKLTDTVSQHFMGIQLSCAQCHNHPFNGWKQNEYWGMAAFFSKVQPQNPKNTNQGGDNSKLGVQEGSSKAKLKDFFPESTKTVPAKFLGGPEPKLVESQPYRPILGAWLTSGDNPYFARAMVNRTWAQMFGHGFINPIDDMVDLKDATHPELLDSLSKQFVANDFDVKNLIRTICATKAYQRTSKPGASGDPVEHQDLFAQMNVKVLSPEQLFDSLALVTGFAAGKDNAKRPQNAGKGQPNTPRDQFVQFFLAGAEQANTTEYEAGIPQALRLMNSRILGNPNALRSVAPANAKPAEVFEKIYLNTLSRRPTAEEVTRLTEYMSKASSATEAYGDILWAVLNSSEFTMVR